ncbi:fungal-specific transcription factor domain-containing protein [Phascolomyces articulosus]|uniref:Fungal-specific transcription factor domain-containing protein n=1 Tax=Phascolomyces articulosus TaxID=60185 RepID=A0AAD5KEY2_9FUNG|nr:fungal-specific transcription factor domain-containing protein [Phascolomyces articulosus]
MESHATSYKNKPNISPSSTITKATGPQQIQPRLATILPLPYVNPNRIIDIPRQKRSKAKRSCDSCRKRRIRCNADTVQPCYGCKSVGAECHFRDNINTNKNDNNNDNNTNMNNNNDEQQEQAKQSSQSHIEAFEDRVSRLENIIQGVQNKYKRDQDSQRQQQSDMDEDDDDIDVNEKDIGKGAASSRTLIGTHNYHVHDGVSSSIVATLCGFKDVIPVSPTEEMVEHMSLLQINDYDRTRYIGSSSGVHLLNQSIFTSNMIHRIIYDQPCTTSWVAQKLNNDKSEQVIIKARAREPSPPLPFSDDIRPIVLKKLSLLDDIPHLTDELIELMIHAYFTFVQPHIPILNKLSFLEQYYFQNPHPPDEYLLSAMCVVATDFLHFQDDYVIGTNFDRKTIHIIKRCLRDKAMKIMEVVYRRSRISSLQTLILLATFVTLCDSSDEEDDSIHWILTGTAIRMAQDLGLHRSSTRWNIPQREIEHRRRLWYSLYIMDKWVAAELGRPIAIPEEEFDVELPSPHEIDSAYHPVNDDDREMRGPMLICQAETCIREKRQEYAPFLSVISLSAILRKILVIYSPKLQNDKNRNIEEIVDALDIELNQWRANLPPDIQFNIRNPAESNGHGVVLYIFYHCLVILLHRPFIAGPYCDGNSLHSLRSQSSCTTAALNIIDATQLMVNSGSSHLPRSFLGYSVFQASIIFILNAGSEDENVRRVGCRNLARCASVYSVDGMRFRVARILNQLSKRYPDESTTADSNNYDENNVRNGPIHNIHNSNNLNHNNSTNSDTHKKQNREVTVPMLSSTSAEALFASSLPREIALFNKLPNNRILRPCFQDLRVRIPPPGPLQPTAPNSSETRRPTIYFPTDTINVTNMTIQQIHLQQQQLEIQHNQQQIQQQQQQYQQLQQQPLLNIATTTSSSSSIPVDTALYSNYGQQPTENNNIATMSTQHDMIPNNIMENVSGIDASSTYLDRVFREQQMALSSAMDLLPLNNLPEGTYWTQDDWDTFLQGLGYERSL